MRTGFVAVAGAAALAGAGAAVAMAQPGRPPTAASVDTRPPLGPHDVVVERRPTGGSRWHPAKAFAKRVQGRATVTCRVTEAGRMADCEAVAEDPPGWGFGEAVAKQAEAEVRIGPKARDGSPTAGRLFSFERLFALGGTLPKSPMPLPQGEIGDDGLIYRSLQPVRGEEAYRCFRGLDDAERVTLKLACRTGPADTLADCRLAENSMAPDARYEAAAVCTAKHMRIRVSRPDGTPVMGVEVKVPLTYVKP